MCNRGSDRRRGAAVCNVHSRADECESLRIDQMLCFVAEGAFRFHAPASHPPDCIVESGGWPKACAIRLSGAITCGPNALSKGFGVERDQDWIGHANIQ